MLSVRQMEELGMMNSFNRKKSRVITSTYTVLNIKDDTVKDETKMADLREGIKLYASASRNALGKLDNQYGIHVDPLKGTGEVYMFSLYAFPAALDSHIGKVFDAYCNKILPYTDMKELITTTGEEDMQFWERSIQGYGSQANKLCVLLNINDPEIIPYVDPISATVDELVTMGVTMDFAQQCYDAILGGVPEPSKYRSVLNIVHKTKDTVIGDKEKINRMKIAVTRYADAARTTVGKLACEIAFSEEHNELYIMENFNSKESSMAHIGQCLKYIVDLHNYLYLDQLVVSCGKEDMEYFQSIGQTWKPKSKLIVMECIE